MVTVVPAQPWRALLLALVAQRDGTRTPWEILLAAALLLAAVRFASAVQIFSAAVRSARVAGRALHATNMSWLELGGW